MAKTPHTVHLDDEIWAIVTRTATASRRGIGQQVEHFIELGHSIELDRADAQNLPKAS